MHSDRGSTPVGDVASVDCRVAGSHTHQSQLVGQQGEVRGGGGEGVHEREGRGHHRVHLPLVQGHGRVCGVGAVEGGVGARGERQ